MKDLTQEQIIRLYNIIDFTETECIEKAYYGNNLIEITIRDTKTNEIKSYDLYLENDLETFNFIINGIKLERECL